MVNSIEEDVIIVKVNRNDVNNNDQDMKKIWMD